MNRSLRVTQMQAWLELTAGALVGRRACLLCQQATCKASNPSGTGKLLTSKMCSACALPPVSLDADWM